MPSSTRRVLQAARIGATDLSRRLVPARADDEIRRLADTVNDLLVRLDVAAALVARLPATG